MQKIEAPKRVVSPREVLRAAPARKTAVGPKTVGSFVPRLTRTAFEKFGFSAATLITDWAQIVGADLAKHTAPDRLKWPKPVARSGQEIDEIDQGRPGATLVLTVDAGRALDIQYKGRQLIERINAYFGYRAVAEIRIVQGPVAQRVPFGAAPAVLAPARPVAPPAEVGRVEDVDLRAALERMSAGITARAQAHARR